MFYPGLRSATIKFVHRGFVSVKMAATPLTKQSSDEVKVIISCVVKGYQECLFDVDIGEEFEIKTGAPNDRFLGNDLKWLVMHPGVL